MMIVQIPPDIQDCTSWRKNCQSDLPRTRLPWGYKLSLSLIIVIIVMLKQMVICMMIKHSIYSIDASENGYDDDDDDVKEYDDDLYDDIYDDFYDA